MAARKPGGPAATRPPSGEATVLTLIAECVRRPSALAEVGAGGVADWRIRRQLFAVFLAMSFVGSLGTGLIANGFSLAAFLSALGGVPASIVSLLTSTLAMWVLATFFRPKAKFGELLTGLALCNVLSSILLVLACGLGGAMVLTGVAQPLDAAFLLFVLWLVLVCVISGYYIMGAFQVGCGGALLALLLLAGVAGTLQAVQEALLKLILPG